ncbi:uncharacterized protein LOC129001872 isoform X1 [Macrosteles quadrilineatus]|uniref:uncharacterized protein LOC129001872 isoform X1 n=1 Tax=Macrosteles quadrilineatus TaxID=74068 RepID=UPI0023E0C0ED|nr:uncharacterized protein LOC129001872 isoform X1 [Macrosteles quadrilineatus]XP_054285303.1 uncharacterized protein LOC129001872 isoform X1 [Macrosteles quadrilineatus]
MWAIIRIVEDSTYAVVPVSWLVDDNTCYYPDVDSKTLNLLVARAQEPGTNWDVVLIELMDKNIDSFEYCMSIIACLKKGVTSENEKAMSKRKKSSSMNSERSDEESDSSLDDIQSFKKIQTPKKTRTITSKLEPLSPVQSSPIISPAAALRPSTEQVEVCSTQESSCRLPKQSEHYCVFKSKEQVTLEAIGHALCVITRKLEVQENNSSFLKEELRAIRQAIEVKERVQDVPNEQLQNHEELFQELPLNSVEEVDLFEEQLKRKDLFQACISSKSQYAVVGFPDEDDVCVIIPLSWANIEEGWCFYPKIKNEEDVKYHVKAQTRPSEDWEKRNIHLLQTYEKYSDARTEYKEVELSVNLESDYEMTSKARKRKASSRLQYPGEDGVGTDISDSETEDCQPNRKVKKTPINPNPVFTPTIFPEENLIEKSSNQNTKLPVPSTVLSSKNRNCETTKEVTNSLDQGGIDKMLQITMQLQAAVFHNVRRLISMEEKLDRLLAKPTNNQWSENNDVHPHLLGFLPFQSMADFEATEAKLKESPSLRNKFVKLFMGVGGHDIKNMSINIMRRTLTDELGQNFSFTGKKGFTDKIAFVTTQLYSVIRLAVWNWYKDKFCETSLKRHISTWLQQSKHRLIRRTERRNLTESRESNQEGFPSNDEDQPGVSCN